MSKIPVSTSGMTTRAKAKQIEQKQQGLLVVKGNVQGKCGDSHNADKVKVGDLKRMPGGGASGGVRSLGLHDRGENALAARYDPSASRTFPLEHGGFEISHVADGAAGKKQPRADAVGKQRGSRSSGAERGRNGGQAKRKTGRLSVSRAKADSNIKDPTELTHKGRKHQESMEVAMECATATDQCPTWMPTIEVSMPAFTSRNGGAVGNGLKAVRSASFCFISSISNISAIGNIANTSAISGTIAPATASSATTPSAAAAECVEESLHPDLPAGVVDIDAGADGDSIPSTYSRDVMNYLLSTETLWVMPFGFLNNSPDVTPRMRAVLMDWLLQVQEHEELQWETLHVCRAMIDRVLARGGVVMPRLQLLGITCLLIASKFCERFCTEVKVLCFLTDNTYTTDELLEHEKVVLEILDWDVTRPVCTHFLERYLLVHHNHEKTQHLARYLLDLAVTNPKLACVRASKAAAAAMLLARKLYLHHYHHHHQPQQHQQLQPQSTKQESLCTGGGGGGSGGGSLSHTSAFSSKSNTIYRGSAASEGQEARVHRGVRPVEDASGGDAAWTPALEFYTGYKEAELWYECAEFTQLLAKATNSKFQGARTKYNCEDKCFVSHDAMLERGNFLGTVLTVTSSSS